jgi:glycerate kinase
MGRMSHVVVAPDKFKGTLTATQVASHVAAGFARVRPDLAAVQVPVADGGDGTVDAAEAAGYRRVEIGVRGPTGKPVNASFALLGETAVVESAQACGLARLPGGELAPLTATSRGAGELILAAVRMRAKRIVIGLGGVACTDGGAGLVTALGGRLLDASGNELPPGGAALATLDRVDVRRLRDLGGAEVIAATDVDNPLLGPHGAAAVYGPQKGASPQDVALLEQGLARWAEVAEKSFGFDKRDEPGAGAAGGLGFAVLGVLGAGAQPGIELMLDLLSFAGHLPGARLVVTGEGALDEQTLHGKAPAGVARAAAAAAGLGKSDTAAAGLGKSDTAAAGLGKSDTAAAGLGKSDTASGPDLPVVAVCGVSSLSPEQLRSAGITRAYALADIEPDLTRCREQAGPLLEDLAERVARDWLVP